MSDVRRPSRSTAPRESGVAVISAIIIMILVTGTVALMTFSSDTRRAEERANRARTVSDVMLLAAADDLAERLERGEIGQTVTRPTNGSTYAHLSLRLVNNRPRYDLRDGSNRLLGRYDVLRPPITYCSNCAAGGMLDVNPASTKRGTVTFFIQAESVEGRRGQRLKVVLRRGSVSRYALLGDRSLALGSLGSVTLPAGSSIHSNNSDDAAVGISLQNVSSSSVRRITSRSGSITNCFAQRCEVTNRIVPFASAVQAMDRVRTSATQLRACEAAPRMCLVPVQLLGQSVRHRDDPRSPTIPMFGVRLQGNCVEVDLLQNRVRLGTTTYPMIDDSLRPYVERQNIRRICPPSGGTAILFEGDVLVQGSLTGGSGPVTIMTRRSVDNPKISLFGEDRQMTEPASIHVVGQGGRFGGDPGSSTQLPAQLGLVAQGGVYVPTWSVGGDLTIQETSVMSVEGGFSLGQWFLQNSADPTSGNVTSGGGVDPCGPAASALPRGGTIRFMGTVATRSGTFFGYSTGCERGYAGRAFTFDESLGYLPPPFFPATDPWHVVDLAEYRGV